MSCFILYTHATVCTEALREGRLFLGPATLVCSAPSQHPSLAHPIIAVYKSPSYPAFASAPSTHPRGFLLNMEPHAVASAAMLIARGMFFALAS